MSDKQPDQAAAANGDADETLDDVVLEGEVTDEDAPDDPLPTEIDALRVELAEQGDRLLRTVAEMDNLRKRTRREVVDSRRFAQADVLRPMLEILDNFDRALAAEAEGDADGDAAFRAGVEMIAQSFRQALQDRGVQVIAAEGAEFDPAVHEAVGQQPAPDGVESGSVMAVVQQGYTLGEMVLRASRVIVAQ